MTIEFEAWPSISRLYREAIVTEKLDGSNAAFVVVEAEDDYLDSEYVGGTFSTVDGVSYKFAAQSRKRLISPKDDNFGFAKWAWGNAQALVGVLGPGKHYGEWWGNGIQRGYGLPRGEKRFSLFNTPRWRDTDLSSVDGLGVVPELYVGPFSLDKIEVVKENLLKYGSVASPGFMDPEGVVVYHTASRTAYKSTFDACDDPDWGGGKTWQK